jgi:hypothetical protein
MHKQPEGQRSWRAAELFGVPLATDQAMSALPA